MFVDDEIDLPQSSTVAAGFPTPNGSNRECPGPAAVYRGSLQRRRVLLVEGPACSDLRAAAAVLLEL
eukprot:scaffold164234_cov28-Attheya_sp.AAC.1